MSVSLILAVHICLNGPVEQQESNKIRLSLVVEVVLEVVAVVTVIEAWRLEFTQRSP